MVENQIRILCVVDDQDSGDMLKAVLGNAGYEVSVATQVTEGLRLAKHEGCDLILTDLYFRDGTGLELCQMVRTFDSITPILFCTHVAEPAHVEHARQAGAQGYLIKPCESDKLHRAIAALLAKRRLNALQANSRMQRIAHAK